MLNGVSVRYQFYFMNRIPLKVKQPNTILFLYYFIGVFLVHAFVIFNSLRSGYAQIRKCTGCSLGIVLAPVRRHSSVTTWNQMLLIESLKQNPVRIK